VIYTCKDVCWWRNLPKQSWILISSELIKINIALQTEESEIIYRRHKRAKCFISNLCHNGRSEKHSLCRGTAVRHTATRDVSEAELAWQQASRRLHRRFLPVWSSYSWVTSRARGNAVRDAGGGPHQRESNGAAELHVAHVLEWHGGRMLLSNIGKVFWGVTPCSVAVGYQRFTLKMEKAMSSETLMSYLDNTWHHNPEALWLNRKGCVTRP